jgi:hypothetical protein
MIIGNNINNNTINENQSIERINMQEMMIQMMKQMAEQQKITTQLVQQMGIQQQSQDSHLQKQLELQKEQIDQHKSSAEHSLARTSAGIPPTFQGKYNDIIVHSWIISMEQWFTSAEIIDDKEKIKISIPYLKDSAQSWWEAEKSSGKAVMYTKWDDFSEAIRKQFFPQDVTRWAKLQLKELTSKTNTNIISYSQKYSELDKLAGKREIEDIMVDFEFGLPEEYKIKCAEKRYQNLSDMMSAMVMIYNARALSKSQSNKTPAINKMERDENGVQSSCNAAMEEEGVDGNNMEGVKTEQSISNSELVSQLHAMFGQQFLSRGGFNSNYRGNNYKGGFNRGGFNNRGGYKGRNRYQGSKPEGSTSSGRPRSPSAERISGLSKETIGERLSQQVCIKCAEKGHFARECPNPVKLN